jgi:hypothetical protein
MLSDRVTVLAATSGTVPAASIASLVVSLAILAFILYRQCVVRPLRTTLVLPIVLIVLGLGGLIGATHGQPMTSREIGILAALLGGDAVVLGALRARTVRLWREGGVIFRQGTWFTVALWLAGVGIHEAVVAAAHLSPASLDLYIGLTLAAQRLVLDARARRLGPEPPGIPSPPRLARHRPPPAGLDSAG